MNIKLRDEFFEYIKGYSILILEDIINNLSKQKYNFLIRYWEVNSKYKVTSAAAQSVISTIKKELNKTYKINLREIFKTNYETLASAIGKLDFLEFKLLSKKYIMSDTRVLQEPVTKKEELLIKDILIKISNNIYIKGKSKKLNRKKSVYKSFFDLFKGSTRKEIMTEFNNLPENEQELLKKKYGEDLLSTKQNPSLTEEENIYINTFIIVKIRRRLKNIKNGWVYYGITDLFPELTFEEIQTKVNSLKTKEKEEVENLFGTDLTKKVLCSPNRKNFIIDTCIKNKIYNDKKDKTKNPTPIKPFYDIFRKYKEKNESEESFRSRVNSCIRSKDLEKLVKKYGHDLGKTKNDGSYTKEEDKYIINVVIPQIKLRMKNYDKAKERKYKPLISRFAGFIKEEELTESLTILSAEELKLLKLKYDKDLKTSKIYASLGIEINYEIKLIIAKLERYIFRKVKERTKIGVKLLHKIKVLEQTKEFESLLQMFSYNETLAIIVKANFESISNSQISALTGIEPNEIIRLSFKYLEIKMNGLGIGIESNKKLVL